MAFENNEREEEKKLREEKGAGENRRGSHRRFQREGGRKGVRSKAGGCST